MRRTAGRTAGCGEGGGSEVEPADEPGGGGAEQEAGDDTGEGEHEGFQEKEAGELKLGAAERLHEGEVAAALQNRGGEGGEDGDGDGESDEQDGGGHEGVGSVGRCDFHLRRAGGRGGDGELREGTAEPVKGRTGCGRSCRGPGSEGRRGRLL